MYVYYSLLLSLTCSMRPISFIANTNKILAEKNRVLAKEWQEMSPDCKEQYKSSARTTGIAGSNEHNEKKEARRVLSHLSAIVIHALLYFRKNSYSHL